MPARDYATPQHPSFVGQNQGETSNSISFRRRLRVQNETDQDLDPAHNLPPCCAYYEVEDRSLPSVSSF